MRFKYLACALALGFVGCGESNAPAPAPEGPHSLSGLEGKGDNYISSNAREFEMHGLAHVALSAGFAELDEEAQSVELDKLVQRRLSVVTKAIQSHVEKVVRESNQGVEDDRDKYFTFFKRNSANTEDGVLVDDERALFEFKVEFVGTPTLLAQVAPDDTARRVFEVEVKDWNETTGERVEVEIRESPSTDAFPKYDELFADGVLDIGMHFGGDYNAGRYDLETARWTVETLLGPGWSNAEVTSFEELGFDSPPFTRSVLVEGKEVEIRVFISHAAMDGPGEQHLLAEAVKKSLAERDIVLYSGHAGSGAGFILDYSPKYEIKASDFATIELSEKYQIYVLDGCMTYRTYVDDLLKNPAKNFDNLNIITTVNTTPFSVGYQVIHQLLNWFTMTDDYGNHFPVSWQRMLQGLNTEEHHNIYYGVHGVDTNPKLNPHASEGIACSPCESDNDCGAGGNLCLGYSLGSACGVACTTDEACGEGYRCQDVIEDPAQFHIPKQCVRKSFDCR
ncbi:MAG: hypothetical protein H0U74_11140 [Bradymonadaceae bacterium]|nr:hypothetical protein [Lujinxingiaceae bacterium]